MILVLVTMILVPVTMLIPAVPRVSLAPILVRDFFH